MTAGKSLEEVIIVSLSLVICRIGLVFLVRDTDKVAADSSCL